MKGWAEAASGRGCVREAPGGAAGPGVLVRVQAAAGVQPGQECSKPGPGSWRLPAAPAALRTPPHEAAEGLGQSWGWRGEEAAGRG